MMKSWWVCLLLCCGLPALAEQPAFTLQIGAVKQVVRIGAGAGYVEGFRVGGRE